MSNFPALLQIPSGYVSRRALVAEIITSENVLREVTMTDGSKFTDHQIKSLMSLQTTSENILVFQPVKPGNHKHLLYETVCAADKNGADTAITNLSRCCDKNMEKSQIPYMFFQSESFRKEKNRYLASMEHLRGEVEVSEGITECPRCHSLATVTMEIQTSRGDEGYTNKNWCVCGHTWSFRN